MHNYVETRRTERMNENSGFTISQLQHDYGNRFSLIFMQLCSHWSWIYFDKSNMHLFSKNVITPLKWIGKAHLFYSMRNPRIISKIRPLTIIDWLLILTKIDKCIRKWGEYKKQERANKRPFSNHFVPCFPPGLFWFRWIALSASCPTRAINVSSRAYK